MERPNRYRSLFWPMVLIGVGLIALLSNLGVIPPANINLVLSLWPLILIVIGLDLLFGRQSPAVGGLIGLLAIAGVLVVLIAGPAMGLKAPGGDFKQEHFSEPVGQATSASYNISTASQPVRVYALSGSGQLIDANIGHYGIIDFSASGTTDKVVNLEHRGTGTLTFDLGNSQARWDIGLSPEVPAALNLNTGSGSTQLDLNGLKLTDLHLDSGSGSINGTLPTADKAYTANIKSGSGSVNLTLPANTDLTLSTDSGSGSVSLRLPAGAAARVEVTDNGSGSVNISHSLQQISGSGDNHDQGTWETSGYASAARKILIRVTGLGSGSLNIE